MSTKDFSNAQEKLVAEYLGEDWKVVTGSGAAPCTPGDVIGPDWLVECKTHTVRVPNLIFNRHVWKKIKEEAVVKRRFPMLVTDNGTQRLDKTWILIKEIHIPTNDEHVILPLEVRSTVNLIVDISEVEAMFKSACIERKHSHDNFLFRCKLDKDDCVIMKLTTFSKLLGD